jgi:hypothetical protein
VGWLMEGRAEEKWRGNRENSVSIAFVLVVCIDVCGSTLIHDYFLFDVVF